MGRGDFSAMITGIKVTKESIGTAVAFGFGVIVSKVAKDAGIDVDPVVVAGAVTVVGNALIRGLSNVIKHRR